ncbi:methyltransferase [Demequina sp. TTPB684]|uniref:class I SAM-dependent methyltransferase n=1 Tax=unclassified Demequina TaxID=2620311 RepID=UPI001CF1F906|nr:MULTISPECIES: methyltransferase [unclassified Demequina]MCB2413739.1 methyltransferase [Demequina sp. TTPB684]UPU89590.1 methyltransferase [Demequina sp. TMPB413]
MGNVEHYFSAQPASADERRQISVTLHGRSYSLETAPGVFSPAHVDLGTTVLLDTVDTPPAGEVLDLGCGWGPIALTAALMEPRARVTAVDVNERALDLLRLNEATVRASTPEMAAVEAVTPDAVPDTARFDAIWSNPPIRVGKPALHALLATWLPRLKPGGEALLVVQKNLGADSLARWITEQTDDAGSRWGEVEKVRSSKGFRVLRLVRG